MTPHHRVVIVAFPPAQLIDVIGPSDTLAMANRAAARHAIPLRYEVLVAAPQAGPVMGNANGVAIHASRSIVNDPPIPDTLLIAGGAGSTELGPDDDALKALTALCARAQRVGALDSGVFALAATGLLDGRSAATHWQLYESFAARFPDVLLNRDALFVVDQKFSTGAGMCASFDNILMMVQHDMGPAVALELARELVLFIKRPAGQSQLSVHLSTPSTSRDTGKFGELSRWLESHLTEDLTVELMAERMAMSPRNFARRFKEVMHVTPSAHVQVLRVEAARRLLCETELSVARVAEQCGFASTPALRTEFLAQTEVTPEEFRARFRKHDGRYCFS
jgi:transcriptional regulator GlxA family with amidase domain